MPLAACMVSLQFLLQLVKLSRPFGLSLRRLFESFVMFVYVTIFSFSLLSFIGIVAKLLGKPDDRVGRCE